MIKPGARNYYLNVTAKEAYEQVRNGTWNRPLFEAWFKLHLDDANNAGWLEHVSLTNFIEDQRR